MHTLCLSLLILVGLMVAFTIGRYVGPPTDGGLVGRFRAYRAESKRARERARELRKFELIGQLRANMHVYWFGRQSHDTVEFAYFYVNKKGERKVEVSDDTMREHPAVVNFLAGKSVDEIRAVINDWNLKAA